MKKFSRVIMFLLISLLGPLLWWLSGGTERNIELGFLTAGAMAIGVIFVTAPFPYPWE